MSVAWGISVIVYKAILLLCLPKQEHGLPESQEENLSIFSMDSVKLEVCHPV